MELDIIFIMDKIRGIVNDYMMKSRMCLCESLNSSWF